MADYFVSITGEGGISHIARGDSHPLCDAFITVCGTDVLGDVDAAYAFIRSQERACTNCLFKLAALAGQRSETEARRG